MKTLYLITLVFLSVLTACSAENILQNYNDGVSLSAVVTPPEPPVPADPEVVFTYFPPIPTGSYVSGKVISINPASYKLCLWINVPGWGWVPKPYYAWPFTTIAANSNWATTFYTGGHDYDADFMIQYAIPMSYPSYANPTTLAVDSLTYTILDRWDARYGAAPAIAVTNYSLTYYVISNMTGPTNITLMGTASDARYLRGVFLSLNGASYRAIRPNKNVLWHSSMAWSTNVTLQMGSNVFRCYSKDCGEHDSPVTEIVFVLGPDIEPPVADFTTPDGYSATGSPMTVTGTATDNIRVARVNITANGELAASFAPRSASWSADIPLQTGQSVLTVTAVDVNGNVSDARSITVTCLPSGGGGGDGGGPGGFTR